MPERDLREEVGNRVLSALSHENDQAMEARVYIRAIAEEAMGGAFACLVCARLRKQWEHEEGEWT